MCAEDLFWACSDLNSRSDGGTLPLVFTVTDADLLCGALLDSRASNAPKATRVAAASALAQAVMPGSGRQLLTLLAPALSSKSGHKNRDVAEQA